MTTKTKFIPAKVLFSYLVITGLIVFVGYLLYKENIVFTQQEQRAEIESKKLIQLSGLISQIYKVDNLSRIFTQTNQAADFEKYTTENDFLLVEIDSLQIQINTPLQTQFLDSLKLLLSQKVSNIKELEQINNRKTSVIPVEKALNSIKDMEAVKGKLILENFIKHPDQLSLHERKIAQEYIDYLNANVPKDASNTFSQKEIDSILTASKQALEDVKKNNEHKNKALKNKEIELLKNDSQISQSINTILSEFERDVMVKNHQNNLDKEKSQTRILKILKYSAIIGLTLTAVFFFLISSDFLKNQRYRQALEREKLKTETLLKSREQLIATVSHDVRTPLHTIQGYSDLLLQSANGEKQQHYLNNIKNSSVYINQLVNDLLDYSKLEAGKISIEKTAVNLDVLLTEIVQNIQAVYTNKRIAAVLELDAINSKAFYTDALKIKQIVSNLVGNAFKFTDEGFVKVKAQNSKGSVIITVQDSGIGIDKAHQKFVFDEFTQAHPAIEKKFGGTGLGLTICKKLTEILGGTLTLESELGKGSSFKVAIPMDNTDKDYFLNKDVDQERLDLNVLLVDDDIGLLQLTGEILKQQGFKINTFSSAKQALEYAVTHKFDLVITDIQMPEMDGFEFVKALRIQLGVQEVPVIAVTGRQNVSESIYQQAGFEAVVQKPYQTKELMQTINKILHTDFVVFQNESVMDTIPKEYSLKVLEQFLHQDKNALKEVLQAFVQSNEASMLSLKKALMTSQINEITAVSHKMIPMLVQIEAHEIADSLRKLENWESNGLTLERMEPIVVYCEEKMKLLLGQINAEIDKI